MPTQLRTTQRTVVGCEAQRDRHARILEGIGADTPAARTAVAGRLWFMDGARLDRIARRDVDRAQLLGPLLGALLGALTAAGVTPPAAVEAS